MSVGREDWARRQMQTARVAGGAEHEKRMPYDDALARVYEYIKAQRAQSDEMEILSAEERAKSIEIMVARWIELFKPQVNGFIENGVMQPNRLWQTIVDDINNWGPLTEAKEDPSIDEIQINDYKTIWCEVRGEKRPLYNSLGKRVEFKDPDDLLKFLNRLLAFSNRTLTITDAKQDGVTIDGYRIAATHPVTMSADKGRYAHKRRSPTATIRKQNENIITFRNLVTKYHSISYEMAVTLQLALRAKLSVIVVGPTGSGKTVIVQGTLDGRPDELRTIIIEGQSEIRGNKRDKDGYGISNTVMWESMEYPPGKPVKDTYRSTENLGRHCMRSTPDIICLGEMRQPGEFAVMQDMTMTGHITIGTFHAKDEEEAIDREVDKVILTNPGATRDSVMMQVCRSVDLVVVQEKLGDGTRKVTSLSYIHGYRTEDGKVRPNVIRLHEYVTDGRGIHREDRLIHGAHYQVGEFPMELRKSFSKCKLYEEEIEHLMTRLAAVDEGSGERSRWLAGTYEWKEEEGGEGAS